MSYNKDKGEGKRGTEDQKEMARKNGMESSKENEEVYNLSVYVNEN